jgi:hypothetical protein
MWPSSGPWHSLCSVNSTAFIQARGIVNSVVPLWLAATPNTAKLKTIAHVFVKARLMFFIRQSHFPRRKSFAASRAKKKDAPMGVPLHFVLEVSLCSPLGRAHFAN